MDRQEANQSLQTTRLAVSFSREGFLNSHAPSRVSELRRSAGTVKIFGRTVITSAVILIGAALTAELIWFRQLRLISDQENHPIDFYGVCVDQHGNPVGGVSVRFLIRWNKKIWPTTIGEALTERSVSSDASGLFRLTGEHGSLLEVQSVAKPGYETDSRLRVFAYGLVSESERYVPDPGKPEQFYLWKLRGADRLEKGEKFFGLVPDGRPFTIDFADGTKREGAFGDDLVVSIFRESQIDGGEPYDWSCRIVVANGGIIETADRFMYCAPESGYVSQWELKMSASQPDWSDRTRKRFYLSARQGHLFARLEVEIFSRYRDGAVFSVKYFANTLGSRNLEYDPLQNVSSATPPRHP